MSQLNGGDATAVGEAFSVATFSYDTVTDRSPADAERRSAQLATPAYAAQLREPGDQSGGALWNTLAAHHGYTTTALSANHDDGRPPDSATAAVRAWTITSTGHSADGWSAPMGSVLMFVSMTRGQPADPWRVAAVQIPAAS